MKNIFGFKNEWLANRENLNKETRKIIERNLPKTVRNAYKNGEEITVRIYRRKWLHRWGDEVLLILRKNGKIIYNGACENAWNADPEHYNPDKIEKEAKNAIDYFVYGEKKYDFWIEACY